jgi:hypothetical protein
MPRRQHRASLLKKLSTRLFVIGGSESRPLEFGIWTNTLLAPTSYLHLHLHLHLRLPSRGQPFILQPSGHRRQRPSTVAAADRAWTVLCSASNVANGDCSALDKVTRQQGNSATRTATPENVIGRNMSIPSGVEHEHQIIEEVSRDGRSSTPSSQLIPGHTTAQHGR